jgi:tetratricopeptide (TPR) repeat protein
MAILLLAAGLTAAAAPSFPQPPASRGAALAALASADELSRAEAVAWIANHGGMADAPLLHERLRDASPTVRAYAEQGLWLLWSRSGDASIDRMMAIGSDLMNTGQLEAAVATFSTIIERRPEFAEGWNRRATAWFLAQEYERSIADCHEVLKRNPGHFGALSGMGQIHLARQEPEEALAWFRRALAVNPNMQGVESNVRELEEIVRHRRRPTT